MLRYSNRRAKWMAPLAVFVMEVGLGAVSPGHVAAQAPAAKKPTAARQAAPTATKTKQPIAPPAANSTEVAAREQILKSDELQDTLSRFDQWLSKQTLYDAEQVKRTRLRLGAGIKRMTSAQLQRFMTEMNAKLEVLTGEHAQDAQEHLSETLSVASEAYARKVRQGLPDVLSMNALQIDQKLASINTKRDASAQMQKRFDVSRQRMVASNEAQKRERQRAQQDEAADRAGNYSSSSQPNNFTPAADYYPNLYDAYDSGYDGYAGVTLPLGGYRF
ncbi:MAG TPA: hypothetical protein VGN12_05380 [Pirellulales bacterium]|jgi:hypothetical protein